MIAFIKNSKGNVFAKEKVNSLNIEEEKKTIRLDCSDAEINLEAQSGSVEVLLYSDSGQHIGTKILKNNG